MACSNEILNDRICKLFSGECDRDEIWKGIVDLLGPTFLRNRKYKLGSLHDAEDVCQEMFLAVSENFHECNHKDPKVLISWMRKVLDWRSLDILRKRNQGKQHLELEEIDRPLTEDELCRRELRHFHDANNFDDAQLYHENQCDYRAGRDPVANVLLQERIGNVSRMMSKLTENERLCIEERYFNGKSRGEIATTYGLSDAAVKANLESARFKMFRAWVQEKIAHLTEEQKQVYNLRYVERNSLEEVGERIGKSEKQVTAIIEAIKQTVGSYL